MARSLTLTIAVVFAASFGTGLPAAVLGSPSSHVQALLQAMSLDEKANLITGANDPDYRGQAGYAPGLPRLKIPALRWANGPLGIEVEADATAIPGGLTLAATFDPDLARDSGALLGREARALGIDVVNGPQLDIARIPSWGRNSAALGEDPLLSGRLGAAEIEGMQAQGVLATAKHYIAYTQAEHVRSGTRQEAIPYDFLIDSRALHEIYLPSFEAAAAAGTASFMAAHMIVNGQYGTENRTDLTEILRDELSWGGYVVSDWNATHSPYALTAGVDVEMPGYGIEGAAVRPYYFGDKMAALVRAGRMPEAAVDRAAGRLLMQMERFGFLDNTRVVRPNVIDVEGGARLSREIAAKGAVLLKNDGILPLKTHSLASTVLIGPTAAQLAVGAGNGRAYGFEAREVSPLAVLRKAAPRLAYSVGDDLTGVAIPSTVLMPASGQGHGLTRSSTVGGAKIDATLDFVGRKSLPAGTKASWTGTLSVPETGNYLLMIQAWGGSAVLRIDGKEKAAAGRVNTHGFARKWTSLLPTTDGLDNGQSNLHFEAGHPYQIAIEASGSKAAPVQVRLAWVSPEMRRSNITRAAMAARKATTAVVFVWARSGEFTDADGQLALPDDQNDLIEAVATANPNTVVVLNTGGPIRMPWLDRVRGVLEMWYPGQEGGAATADLLTGQVNPGGKLPITFPAAMKDTPAGDPAHPERSLGVDQKIIQSEGIFVGYRYYDHNNIAPLFPFGHGLSYTRFAYSDLKISRTDIGFDVEFTLRNVGSRPGSEVPQVYVGPGASDIPMAPRALAGFARIELEPGAAQAVRIHVPARQLAYWSVERRNWVTPAGPRTIYVGSSSRDTRLAGELNSN
jgi:beta-glucosidase